MTSAVSILGPVCVRSKEVYTGYRKKSHVQPKLRHGTSGLAYNVNQKTRLTLAIKFYRDCTSATLREKEIEQAW